MGGYAEYTAVPASMAYVVPAEIEPGVAAAALLQGLTALTLTHNTYHVRKGDWALVHAAAGGTGLWLCRVLKSLGANIIGTASTAEKMQLAKENGGADFLINYREEKDLVKKVEEITGGQGVDVVFDGIGKDQTENNVNVVAKDGTIVTFGVAVCIYIAAFYTLEFPKITDVKQSGIPPPISPAKFAAKNVRLVGPGESALMRSVGTPKEFAKWCAKLFDVITTDKEKKVRIHDTYPLSQIVKVHQDLEGRKTMGKILVKP